MKTLITGAAGLLGKALMKVLPGTIVPCTSRPSPETAGWEVFDVTDREDVLGAIRAHRPDVVVHCAAIGSVDKVQVDFKSGLAVNMHGTSYVIEGARKVKAKLVMVSTNAVFDGRNPPYAEDAHLCPVSNYGIIKAAAELAVRASDVPWVVVRPILMYGNHNPWQRGNWVSAWIDRLSKGQECLVVDDVNTQPLYNHDCAEVISKAIQKEAWGQVFNVGGADCVTLFEFASRVAESYGFPVGLVKPVPSSHFPNIAPRPRDTSFDLSKLRTVLEHEPIGIYDGLTAMQKESNNG